MASEFEVLRLLLQQEFNSAAKEQHQIFIDDGITVEYSLLGHLANLLHEASMLSHTIDRVRMDDSIRRGLADSAAGRVKSLPEYIDED